MEIMPDSKDWTWVLNEQCPECGFDTRKPPREDVADLLRQNANEWVDLLGRLDRPQDRPSPGVWSPLEYACHVRDACRIFDERLELMLREDDPGFANWDQDATAVDEQYGRQDPATVAVELQEAAGAVADRFDQVSGAQWHRTGSRSDGSHFTVESLGRYFIHDPIHHLYDVTGLRADQLT